MFDIRTSGVDACLLSKLSPDLNALSSFIELCHGEESLGHPKVGKRISAQFEEHRFIVTSFAVMKQNSLELRLFA
jgi:hypothetical protein